LEQSPSNGEIPDELAVSIVTVAELRVGVLLAAKDDVRAARLRTLGFAERLQPLPIDDPVADAWARLAVGLRSVGRRLSVNDAWIAATAMAHELSLVTRDADYEGIAGLSVIRV
jgi:predicted nucleic acid-binding protein